MTKETKVRIISAVAVAPFVVACFVSYKSLVGLVAAIISLASYEIHSFSLKGRSGVYITYLTAITAIFPIIFGLFFYNYPHVVFFFLFVVGVVSIMVSSKDYEKAFFEYSVFSIAMIYISLGLSFFLPFYKEYGAGLALLALTAVWAFDSFAYFVGLSYGKIRIFKEYTRKSLEGCIGGFIGTVLYSGIFNYFLIVLKMPHFDFLQIVVFSIIVSIMDTLGDVFESSIKRKFGVKHSGVIMPGHGGMLDRIDGLLFSTPIVYIVLKLIGG